MTKWYNGVEVLDIETIWTGDVKETYQYAFLGTVDGEVVLYLLSGPVVKNTTDTMLLYSLADGHYCYCNIENDAWQQGAQLTSAAGSAIAQSVIEPFWSSWDMMGSNDELYLAASEPTDTAPDTGGDEPTDDPTVEEPELPEPTVFTVVHRIKSDLQQCGVRPRIDVMQGDTNTRILELTLLNGGTPWRPHAETTVLVTYGRSNGTGGVYDTLHNGSPAGTIDGNVVTVTLVPEMTALAGVVRAAVRLLNKSTGDVISTFGFEIAVDPDPAIAAANASGNYINWFGSRGVLINPTELRVVKADNVVTVTATYDDLTTGTSVITLDDEGDPVTVVRNGVACTLIWEGFDE